jgi:hypothetical protein
MFKPLSSSYSKGLINHLHKTQGLVSVKKGNFFPLFWQVWISSFKETSIPKSFKATRIWPMNPEVILKDSITADQTTTKRREAQGPSQIQIGERSGRFWINLLGRRLKRRLRRSAFHFTTFRFKRSL